MAGFRGFQKNAGPWAPPAGSFSFGNITPRNTSPSHPPPSSIMSPPFVNSDLQRSASPRHGSVLPSLDNQLKSSGGYTDHHSSTEAPKSPTEDKSGPSNFRKEVAQKTSHVNKEKATRASLSPPRRVGREKYESQPNLGSSSSAGGIDSADAEVSTASHAHPKRTRSPSPTDRVPRDNICQDQDDTDRELQAKAKRLARFKDELSYHVESVPAVPKQKFSFSGDVANDIDNEDLDSQCLIVGLCPDMCPESERAERERKADLDRYERVDGDRNQTSDALAVKKYTRTAEREAELIRPLPILQKTMEYLLNLLDRPYDDRFLSLYNFLWDRMRAIRMDLRMQHIFNLEAISMLEQMIRLHIIAMHELCEYSKGEGFSEGFDAHLNIEQMNKTSVELFQMYDDHRKKGVYVPTEQEFRGYYALLKLDKHPGYKVEPAELSLELAKMTPEIRQTEEVLVARSVARSCRTSNFIAFFRLARKATYLQACLMHAHFSKLRTQALAALHSGLLNNQGLPMGDVARWLSMEGEDIESLLEYHGFLIKDFEEPYMVKDGPFLNIDEDYPTHCSELVHSKKSRMIAEDVLSSKNETSLLTEEADKREVHKFKKNNKTAAMNIDVAPSVVDEERSGFDIVSTQGGVKPLSPAVRSTNVSSPKDHFDVSSSPRRSMTRQQSLRTVAIAQDRGSGHQSGPVSSPKRSRQLQRAFEVSKYTRQTQYNGEVPQDDGDGHFGNVSCSSKGIAKSQPASGLSNNDWSGKYYHWSTDNSSKLHLFSPNSIREVSHLNGMGALGLKMSQLADNDTSSVSTLRASDGVSGDDKQGLSSTCVLNHEFQHLSRQDMVIEECKAVAADVQPGDDKEEAVASIFDEEVAMAKLKLFLRLWIRRFKRKRKLQELNRLAANAALNSLSLGPSVRLNKDRPNSCGKFDIWKVMSKRFEKHEQSWSLLNVSELVAYKLRDRNLNASCICWKVIVCSNQNLDNSKRKDQVNKLSVDQWVHRKIIPLVEDSDDGLLISSSELSIWKKWVADESGMTCCLSVIRDLKLSNVNESIAGAAAVMFLVSESLPWGVQKTQLHNMVMSLHPSYCLPLLILHGSTSTQEGSLDSAVVTDKLGLYDIDKSRVRNFKVICLGEVRSMGHLEGHFSDEQLREGLMWLATESLPQPVLHHVKVRDLVLAHLNSEIRAFEQKDCLTGPNQCISVINEALERSIGNIVSAANAYPHYPCPELTLLDISTSERKAVEWSLPVMGWSSEAKVESVVSGLGQCKLPAFSDDISWLKRGFDSIQEIEDQRFYLQDCLLRYLARSKIMSLEFAGKEACVMLQRSTRLELHNSSYYLVPTWISIFRRAFNWQLNRLASGEFSAAYILDEHWSACSPDLDKPGNEAPASVPYYLICPSLDEMAEASCIPVVQKRSSWELKNTEPAQLTVSGCRSGEKPAGDKSHLQLHSVADTDVSSSYRLLESADKFIVDPRESREADRLSALLEQCNIVQNKIAEKLSIYF